MIKVYVKFMDAEEAIIFDVNSTNVEFDEDALHYVIDRGRLYLCMDSLQYFYFKEFEG